MSVMTIRGIDDTTAKVLKQKAKKEGVSVNAVLLKTLRESLGLEKKRRTIIYDDLDYLAGTWNEKDFIEFQKQIAGFETVDKKMWK
ncbi:MAG: antitoxin [Nitrospirota bacterium]